MKSKEGDPIVEGVNAKVCSKCGELKPTSEFSRRTRGPQEGQLMSWCKSCCCAYQREWKLNHPEKAKAVRRRHHLRSLYGITEEDYDHMYRAQDGKCALSGKDGKLVIDHNHRTGVVRGLLDDKVNQAIGHLGDNLEGALKAAVYLSKGGLDHPGARETVTDYLRQIILNIGSLSLLRHLDTPFALEPELFEVPEVGEEHSAA